MKVLVLVLLAPLAMAVAPYPWGAVVAAVCIAGIVYLEARRALDKPEISAEHKRQAKRWWDRFDPLS